MKCESTIRKISLIDDKSKIRMENLVTYIKYNITVSPTQYLSCLYTF